MNAIVNMFRNTNDMTTLRQSGYGSAEFDIDTAPLIYFADDDGHEFHSSKSIIYRTDTAQELGVHGHGYQAVAPKKMIDINRAIIERSDLDTTGIQETIRTSHNGSRTFVQYKLPAHTFTTPDGDTAALGLLAVSSFDGTWPFMISAAAIQQACTNLQVFVSGEVAVFKSKHTRNLNIEVGGRVITKALDIFQNERELWGEWSNESMTDIQAFTEAAEAINATSALQVIQNNPNYSPAQVLVDMPRVNSSLEYIWLTWRNTYSKRLGANRWAFYNAMTDWSTHAITQRQSAAGNIAATRNKRQTIIQQHFQKAA
jgi:hypothetical protein|tara:strand:- start:237 stop:1178 length:942 start_codon:yes stop_codon:yes gene_type:complete